MKQCNTRMRKTNEPTTAPPSLPSPHSIGGRREQTTTTFATTSLSRTQDNRPLRPAAGATTFASGRSSYNLNFIDWENEWETHMEEADVPEGGYEVEESKFDEEDIAGINWVEEYRAFWSSIQGEPWPDHRVERLHSAIEQRGGLPPLRALELQTCVVREHQEWKDEADGAVTCGICLEKMKENDTVYLFCHPFHIDCIRPWFMRSHECPLCRGNLFNFL
jgi:hypothetical protein